MENTTNAWLLGPAELMPSILSSGTEGPKLRAHTKQPLYTSSLKMYTQCYTRILYVHTPFRDTSSPLGQQVTASLFDHGILASCSNLGAEVVEKIWNGHQQSTQSTQDGQCPVHS